MRNGKLSYIRLFVTLFCVTLSCMLISCTEKVENAVQVGRFPEIYPDYIDTTIPADIAPLDFNLSDENIDLMDVTVRGSKGGEMHVQGEWADFDIDEWHNITKANKGGTLSFTVCAKKDGKWMQYKDFSISVSNDDIVDWGITYRRIAPGYEVGGDIGIYQRDLHSFSEYPIMTETAVPGRCMNCHTPNRNDASLFTMQIRGEGGGTLIQRDGKQYWYNTKTDSTKAAGSYAYWHPEGRYCAYATNAVWQAFFVGTGQRIEVYHTFSDIVVLDTKTNELITAPQLQTGDQEIFPAFSADGKWLYYSTSKQCKVPDEYEKVKCSLCRIPFDAATGSFGETVDTLLNGPAADKTFLLARPSYDEKWLMYCQAERSNFTIAQKSADLCMMNLQTGETRVMDELNSNDTESYHNWSTNSKWVMFVSKREDGMYAQLFFAHIDEDGKASKPFLLPQRNPRKFYTDIMDSYNVPEFTRTKVDYNIGEGIRKVSSGERIPVKVR